jgi:alpha-methylacyl-CoA racemase
MGPLDGVRVLEIASMAPAPFACMILADLGAEVLRIDRPGPSYLAGTGQGPLGRGRTSAIVDLKQQHGAQTVLRLAERADVLVEGFRPGVAERLGIGPDACLARNPALVYGRMTGFGQDGPLARRAGHDINYIALAGALEPIGRAGDRPVPPLNLVGDFGGGGALLAIGVLAALIERSRSGRGQVVDAAMTDGAALLTTFLHGMIADGGWPGGRGENLLDGGAPYYDTYETADGRYVSVGALEPRFYAELLRGLDIADAPDRSDPANWPDLRARLTTAFAGKTRDEWEKVFDGTDACVFPVLTPAEAAAHPHNRARGTFTEPGGVRQPAPAPRFSRTPSGIANPPPKPGQDTGTALARWGLTAAEIAAVTQPPDPATPRSAVTPQGPDLPATGSAVTQPGPDPPELPHFGKWCQLTAAGAPEAADRWAASITSRAAIASAGSTGGGAPVVSDATTPS